MSEKEKICPNCGNILVKISMYYCFKCENWYEEIDFLPKGEYDKDCKKCQELVPTKFLRNDKPIWYCNGVLSGKEMEKIKDFRKCEHIVYKK